MNTNKTLTDASQFRRWAKGELAGQRITIGALARRLGKSRCAVSRAINRGEFPGIKKAIEKELAL